MATPSPSRSRACERGAIATVHGRIGPRPAARIAQQPVFFVGTAPLSGDGLVDVTRVADACGFAVPRMTVDGDRELLDSRTGRRSAETLRAYRAEENEHSLDGLPGLAGLPAR